MKRLLVCIMLITAALAARPAAVSGQTRADSAAVLLKAAEELRLRGEPGAARAVLDLIAERFAGTPAAASVQAMLVALRSAPDPEESGRTELLVAGTMYGTWLGVAVPLMMESGSPTAYGLGMLLGAPAGFLVAQRYAETERPTKGQARALTFGATWGTYQGLGWMEVLDIGTRSREICPTTDSCFTEETQDADASTWVAAALIGGFAGIGTGTGLASKPITAGTAAAVSLSGMWGTWFGFALGVVAGLEDDRLIAAPLIGGDAALVLAALRAPSWEMTESRARLISVGGLIGGLAGGGLMLIMQPDDEKIAIGVPMLTSAAGLILAAGRTRPESRENRNDPDGGAGAADGRSALLNVRDGSWRFDLPAPSARLIGEAGQVRPALFIPVLSARF